MVREMAGTADYRFWSQKINTHYRVFIFIDVDLIVESWNTFYSWIFEASEAITERRRLENSVISA